MTVLLLDMDARSALVALRSLARAGIEVVCGAHRADAFGFSSRYARRRFVYPSPLTDRDAFIRAVENEVSRLPGDVLIIPCSDGTAGAVHYARTQGKFAWNLVMPAIEDYERAVDKAACGERLREIGVPTPVTFKLDEALKLPLETFRDGLVVKPRRSVSWQGSGGHKGTAHLVHSADELRTRFHAMADHSGQEPLIQARIRGDEYGLGVLAVRGEIRALFAYKRLRSITSWGGVSARRESIPLTDEMRRIAESVVRSFTWHGVLMVELKHDGERLNVIELNARFWGSLALPVRAGVDFPHQLAAVFTEGDVPAQTSYTTHVTARHLVSDISHLYAHGIRALWPFLASFFTDHDDVWDWTDPMPAMRELAHLVRKKIHRITSPEDAAFRVYLVRHADYRLKREANQVVDSHSPLSWLGYFQSMLLARRMRSLGCKSVYASPYVRAQETAARVARTIGVPVITDERLAEFMPTATLAGMERKTANRRAREERGWTHDGETFGESVARLMAALEDIRREKKTACVVTHSLLIQNALMELANTSSAPIIHHVSYTTFEWNGSWCVASIDKPPARIERIASALWRRIQWTVRFAWNTADFSS